MPQRDTRSHVAHLFRRAGFGLRPEELDHFATLGVAASVDQLVNYDAVSNPADVQLPIPDLTPFTYEIVPAAQRTTETLRQQGKLRAQAKNAIQEWWIKRMLTSARPLQEKMTLFWHGHFATGISKAPAQFMLQQNQLFRSSALGNFNTLLNLVNSDPAMLLWLDGAHNRAGKPNENFSRELMELFTIGVGNFSESDVREGARALTGWTTKPLRLALAEASVNTQSLLVPRFFDSGVKTYLGHTGNLGSSDVMAILSAQSAAGPFIARKLFRFFAYDNPSTQDLKPLVDTYYATKYDIKSMVRQLLLSDAFYSDAAYEQHVKSPVEFVVGTVRELGATVPVKAMNRTMALMGQELFNPSNVGGWPGGLSWVNEGTLIERFNFAGLLSQHSAASVHGFDPAQLVQQSGAHSTGDVVDYVLKRFIGVGALPATRAALVDYLGSSLAPNVVETRVRGLLQLVVGSPEYQLN